MFLIQHVYGKFLYLCVIYLNKLFWYAILFACARQLSTSTSSHLLFLQSKYLIIQRKQKWTWIVDTDDGTIKYKKNYRYVNFYSYLLDYVTN